jgi:hypothetical protein
MKANPIKKGRALTPALNKEMRFLLLQVFLPSPTYLSADRQECEGFLMG